MRCELPGEHHRVLDRHRGTLTCANGMRRVTDELHALAVLLRNRIQHVVERGRAPAAVCPNNGAARGASPNTSANSAGDTDFGSGASTAATWADHQIVPSGAVR